MNTPVSFKLAKLLKEKEFDLKVLNHYRGNDLVYHGSFYNFNNPKEQKLWNIKLTSAPIIAEVVMWLYEKHGIWVYPRPVLDKDGEWIFKGYVKLMVNFKAKEIQTKLMRQPTESYEAAITYTLNNLI
jgi:hypothetical protein